MLLNPKLYEINSRIWIKRFGENLKISEIPDNYFKELADKGINIIWMMGIWKTTPQTIDKCCFTPDLASSYNNAVNNWNKEDIIGSPYSIDTYEINSMFGDLDDIKKLRDQLNKFGLKLFFDFVVNHFSSATRLIKSNPEIFLGGDEESLRNDPLTFFRPDQKINNIFAHGKDPFFPAWTDTIQLNYFNQCTRDFMTNILLDIAEICDGVRCDMAMLPLNNVFSNNWVGVLKKFNIQKPKAEFWSEAIKTIKKRSPEFIFLAEAYWDLEWDLQKIGFDFTYDKRFTDRLAANDIEGVKLHLDADMDYQLKSARFLENHDEQRAVIKFGERRSLTSAILMSTIPGMKLYFDGQFEGKKIKLPVQMGKEPVEKASIKIQKFYDKILNITNNKVFREGQFNKLYPISTGGNNYSFEDIFAYEWMLDNEKWIIVINYSNVTSQCRLKFDLNTDKDKITLIDHLSNDTYIRSVEEIKKIGLFVELKNLRAHIFSAK
ncbi:MAG TPA: alpha-amylase family glycosyl hydrolase [Ignavibacteriaceae bacterium]|nr:alpha-amylase family glycosyl hydrolase [Ignavibacteriaceae bacterium]